MKIFANMLLRCSPDGVCRLPHTYLKGDQLLGVDVNGVRLALESLPNDPELLNELTTHKVRCDLLLAMVG